MYAAGILTDETRVELVDGVLIEMNAPSPRHSLVVQRLSEHFVPPSIGRFAVRVQDAHITPDGGFRLPDLMVIPAGGHDRLPERALLVVEVSYSSRARDLGKVGAYATAGVQEYWIVDVDRDEVLVHRSPAAAAYASAERFAAGDHIQPLVDLPAVDVAALLAR